MGYTGLRLITFKDVNRQLSGTTYPINAIQISGRGSSSYRSYESLNLFITLWTSPCYMMSMTTIGTESTLFNNRR